MSHLKVRPFTMLSNLDTGMAHTFMPIDLVLTKQLPCHLSRRCEEKSIQMDFHTNDRDVQIAP